MLEKSRLLHFFPKQHDKKVFEIYQFLAAKSSSRSLVICPSVRWPVGPSGSTCLFTRLEEYSLVPTRFLTAHFLQETFYMKPMFYGRTKMEFLFIASMHCNGEKDK